MYRRFVVLSVARPTDTTSRGNWFTPSAEEGAAKNIAYDTLAKSFEEAGIDPYSETDPIDLISLADDLIVALLAAGTVGGSNSRS